MSANEILHKELCLHWRDTVKEELAVALFAHFSSGRWRTIKCTHITCDRNMSALTLSGVHSEHAACSKVTGRGITTQHQRKGEREIDSWIK